MDAKIFDILSMYTDTEIRFGLSTAGRSDQGAAKAFIEKVLPRAIRSSKFRFESVGNECENHDCSSVTVETTNST